MMFAMMVQTPAPELPPGNFVPEWVAPFLAVVILICIGAWLLRPLIRAWAKRIEGREADASLIEEMARMRDRIAELEMSAMHTQEIEERLDFAERLLAQRSDAPQIPLHRTPV